MAGSTRLMLVGSLLRSWGRKFGGVVAGVLRVCGLSAGARRTRRWEADALVWPGSSADGRRASFGIERQASRLQSALAVPALLAPDRTHADVDNFFRLFAVGR